MRRSGMFIILWVLFIFACSRPSEDKVVQEMLFEVNPDLLGEQVVFDSLGISLYPPIGWNAVTGEMFRQVKAHLLDRTDPDVIVQIIPAGLFLKPSNQSMLNVSEVLTQQNMELSAIIDYLYKMTTLDQGKQQIQRHRFFKDNIFMEQLMIQDQLRVDLKLVFKNNAGRFIEVDYTTMKSDYNNESKAIESSLGMVLFVEK